MIKLTEALSISFTGFIVVMIILGLLAVLVVMLSKAIRGAEKKGTKKEEEDKSAAQAAPAIAAPVNSASAVSAEYTASVKVLGNSLPENQSAGNLDLYMTDEKSAAVIMAIISNKSGIPLNRLQFNSIKLIEKNQGGY